MELSSLAATLVPSDVFAKLDAFDPTSPISVSSGTAVKSGIDAPGNAQDI